METITHNSMVDLNFAAFSPLVLVRPKIRGRFSFTRGGLRIDLDCCKSQVVVSRIGIRN